MLNVQRANSRTRFQASPFSRRPKRRQLPGIRRRREELMQMERAGLVETIGDPWQIKTWIHDPGPATLWWYGGFPKIWVPHGTPKSSILVGIPIINHPFWGTPILGNLHILMIHGFLWCQQPQKDVRQRALKLVGPIAVCPCAFLHYCRPAKNAKAQCFHRPFHA